MSGFGIGEAVKAMRDGKAVRRAGWNGKGMFVVIAGCARARPTAGVIHDRTRVLTTA